MNYKKSMKSKKHLQTTITINEHDLARLGLTYLDVFELFVEGGGGGGRFDMDLKVGCDLNGDDRSRLDLNFDVGVPMLLSDWCLN